MTDASPRYIPTDAECRCRVCGESLANPRLWLDSKPPSRECPDGATIVTDCPTAMHNAKVGAWLIKETGN